MSRARVSPQRGEVRNPAAAPISWSRLSVLARSSVWCSHVQLHAVAVNVRGCPCLIPGPIGLLYHETYAPSGPELLSIYKKNVFTGAQALSIYKNVITSTYKIRSGARFLSIDKCLGLQKTFFYRLIKDLVSGNHASKPCRSNIDRAFTHQA